MKQLSAAMLITALSAFSIPLVIAAEPAQTAGTEQHRENHEHHRGEHVQKNLDALQRQLHLKDSQQAGWTQYKSFVMGTVSDYAKEKENHHKQTAEAREEKSTPAHIQYLVGEMRDRAEKLDKLGKQTDSFYQTLSPEQKTIFDLHWKNRFSHRHWS